ncbi:MAG: OmpA family protein [Chloroflexota bacterium]
MARKRSGGGSFAPTSNAPGWMLTYGDLVTQILIFFVLLFSFSNVDQGKFGAAMISLQGSLGVLPGSTAIIDTGTGSGGTSQPTMTQADMGQLEQAQKLIQEGLGATAGVETTIEDDRGLVIRLKDSILFDSGQADLKPAAKAVLDKVAESARKLPNHIRIEGHTDNRPINTARFPSNWELSTARATNVIRYLIEHSGLSAKRLSAAGYGEYRPVSDNSTEAGRAENRRVDIVLLPITFSAGEPK